jgi:Na+-transporting methylmalonyl-CoA/oxaloacetate decarboxylase gamma subunit
MKTDLINLSIGQGGAIAVLGYAVVFLGLVLLMLVVLAMASFFINKAKKEAAAVKAAPAPEAPAPEAAPVKNIPAAPGSAGELKLYDTDPRDAAMIMAIVADTLGKPLNELRFKSIREVK